MKVAIASTFLTCSCVSFNGVDAFSPTTRAHRASSTVMKLLPNDDETSSTSSSLTNRRNAILSSFGSAVGILTTNAQNSWADGSPQAGGFQVDEFLKTGQVAMPMGVSGQAGKSRPETGIVFRDGSELSRDSRSGDVLTEILLNAQSDDPTAVIATFSSPWPLAKGGVYDIECRDSNYGDSAFLSITGKADGKAVSELPNSFFLDRLFSSTGRFSFYGPPTDIKVRKSYMEGNNRIIELGFSILSQSTGTEIPRNAIIAATIPQGSDEAVMLVGSSTSTRWKKGTEAIVRKTIDSYKAIPAPDTGMKIRAKARDPYAI